MSTIQANTDNIYIYHHIFGTIFSIKLLLISMLYLLNAQKGIYRYRNNYLCYVLFN